MALKNDDQDSMVMQPRKKQSKTPQPLPVEFIKNVAALFNQQFVKERQEASFSLYGALYPNEALLCISMMEVGKLRAVSFYVSADLKEQVMLKPAQVTELLKSMVDLAASWFAQCFLEQRQGGLEAVLAAMEDLDQEWQKVKWEKRDIHVRINRDNQVLEAATDRFLQEGK